MESSVGRDEGVLSAGLDFGLSLAAVAAQSAVFWIPVDSRMTLYVSRKVSRSESAVSQRRQHYGRGVASPAGMEMESGQQDQTMK
ncbi:hypothetical protein CCP1ISM_4950002 [Azospirillaceae bacterium]